MSADADDQVFAASANTRASSRCVTLGVARIVLVTVFVVVTALSVVTAAQYARAVRRTARI